MYDGHCGRPPTFSNEAFHKDREFLLIRKARNDLLVRARFSKSLGCMKLNICAKNIYSMLRQSAVLFQWDGERNRRTSSKTSSGMLGISLRPPRRPRTAFGRDAVPFVCLLEPALFEDLLCFVLIFLRGGMAMTDEGEADDGRSDPRAASANYSTVTD